MKYATIVPGWAYAPIRAITEADYEPKRCVECGRRLDASRSIRQVFCSGRCTSRARVRRIKEKV